MSQVRARAYLWARRLGPGIPVGPGAWVRAYLWVVALGTGHTCGPRCFVQELTDVGARCANLGEAVFR